MKVKCSVCGRIISGKIPAGGDGSMVVPWRHDWQGKICEGSYLEAEIWDDAAEWESRKSEFLKTIETSE